MTSVLLVLALGASGERLVVNDPGHDFRFELPAEFDDALAHFDAPSNWLTGDERIARGVEGLLRLGMTFVVLVLIVGGIGNAIRKRRKQPVQR